MGGAAGTGGGFPSAPAGWVVLALSLIGLIGTGGSGGSNRQATVGLIGDQWTLTITDEGGFTRTITLPTFEAAIGMGEAWVYEGTLP